MSPRLIAILCVLVIGVWYFSGDSGPVELDRPVKIVAFGDSLTAGYKLRPAQAFPAVLEKKLKERGYADINLINKGASGDTTTDGVSRINEIIAENSDIVIIELGANDMLRGIDPSITRQNLENIITRLQSSGHGILLTGMAATPARGMNYANEFNAIFEDLADEYDLAFMPFFLEDVAGVPSLNLPDKLHPNVQGVHIIAENTIPYLEDAFRNWKDTYGY